MSRLARIATAVVLWGGLYWAQEPSLSGSNPEFESANIVSATDVRYPLQSIANGTVILEVAVSETGNVENVQPLRAIPSLTEVTIESVKNWHFKPALLDGKPVRSRTAIAVKFNPAALPASNVPLPPLSAKGHSHSSTLRVSMLATNRSKKPMQIYRKPCSSFLRALSIEILQTGVREIGRAHIQAGEIVRDDPRRHRILQLSCARPQRGSRSHPFAQRQIAREICDGMFLFARGQRIAHNKFFTRYTKQPSGPCSRAKTYRCPGSCTVLDKRPSSSYLIIAAQRKTSSQGALKS